MKLSPHFSLEELTFSQTATRLDIDNSPSPVEIARLKNTAAQMEVVRAFLKNRAIFVSSGFRCLKLNRAIGSGDSSGHVKGYAIDFRVKGLSIEETFKLVKNSGIKFDQLINEYGRWIHLSFDPRLRQQAFKIG